MTIKIKFKSHPYEVEYFNEIPFYNKLIEKPKIKCLKSIDLLIFSFYIDELLFCEQLNIIKTDHAFTEYAMSYKVEIIERKYTINQLCLVIFSDFSDLLTEAKGFKYQTMLKVVLKENKRHGEIEFRSVYFNSTTKAVTNYKFKLENSFQEFCT